ncbi:hypothetical protein HDZ31DRAFT_80603 [Schizophyllum fasciatum]
MGSDDDADVTIVVPDCTEAIEDLTDADEEDATPDSVATRKRAKLGYKKHERFWALDGNVQLHLDGTRFRLHRSRLASQSPWFEALFLRHAGRNAEGYPATDGTVVEDEEDGLIVYLNSTGVILDDMVELLTAMEDTLDYCSEATFPVHAAVYRAGSTLRFDKFARYAEDYILDEDAGFSCRLENIRDGWRPDHIVDAILLGRGWGLSALLKRGFYELARLPDLNDACANPPLDPREIPVDALESADMQLLADVQKKLSLVWADALEGVMASHLRCAGRVTGCQARDRLILYDILYGTGIAKKYTLDPICGLQALIDRDWISQRHCKDCAGLRKKELTKKREEIWAKLDLWLGAVISDYSLS